MVNIKFSNKSNIAREDTKGGVMRAIRQNCLECAGDSSDEVKLCPALDCQLWPYRFGKTPRQLKVAEGKALLNKELFKEGGRFDPLKKASECREG